MLFKSIYQAYPEAEMCERARTFYANLSRRRSVRAFSDRPVPRAVIEDCLRAAGTAPSGANKQPWHLSVVSDPALKRQIRQAAEAGERAFYAGRASEEWLHDLEPLATNADKPFLEIAPYLIVIFGQSYGLDTEGHKVQHYYVSRSVGIATGMLIAAIHNAGLASLPYTPSRPGFLNELLDRPASERPFLILVVGYPASDAHVPDLSRKSLSEIVTFFDEEET